MSPLRKQLEEAIAEKDAQLGLLQKQLKDLQDKIAKMTIARRASA